MRHILAAIIEDAIFCVHGGLSPDSYNPELVITFEPKTLMFRLQLQFIPNITITKFQIVNIERPTGVPVEGMLCDILWSDPCKVVQKYISFLYCLNIPFLNKQHPNQYQ